jgi:NAD(P)-dependent dehydrogenase (short-subunit alcohol dehydrogenase family)
MTAKYALITGGNRGIGLDVSRRLVQKGKPVILTARDPAAGDWGVVGAPGAAGVPLRLGACTATTTAATTRAAGIMITSAAGA